MQNNNLINFRKERDLGDIISDSFKFIRENYKPLFKVVTRVVGPVLLLFVLSFTAYNFIVFQGSGGFLTTEMERHIEELVSRFAITTLLGAVFMIVISFLFYALFYASLNYSIESYIENKGEIVVEEVAEKVRSSWGRFFGLSLMGTLLLMIGFILLFFPGIYLSVPLALVFSVMAFRKTSVSDSIGHSFKLIRGNWWMSFLTLFVILILYYVMTAIFQLPATIYSIVKVMTISGEADFSFTNVFDWIYIALNAFSLLVQSLVFGFVVISSALMYFNLDEKLNRTGAFETIENLGETE